MKHKLVLVPGGWLCKLGEAPPGPFLTHPVNPNDKDPNICFKSEYHTDSGQSKAFCSSGETFCTGDDTMVQPLKCIWEEDDS